MDNAKKLRECIFYGILDTGYVARDMMLEKCRALIAGGAGIVQLRAKRETSAERAAIAGEILSLFDSASAPILIIDDDLELARSLPHAGLHIGQDDIPPREARDALGPGRVIGLSTHNPEQAQAADSLAGVIDYFATGPVYATMTKPGRAPAGLGLVRFAASMKPRLPWFAIGGVNMKTVREVAEAGAERIVAVSDVLMAPDTAKAARELAGEFLRHARRRGEA